MPNTCNQNKSFRYSSAFQALLTGISTNESAALRALALIGADAIGQDLSTVLPDLRQTMGADLPLEIHTALQQMYQQVARKASSSNNTQEADVASTVPPAAVLPEEVNRQDKDTQAGPMMPEREHTQSPVPGDDSLADLGVEYG